MSSLLILKWVEQQCFDVVTNSFKKLHLSLRDGGSEATSSEDSTIYYIGRSLNDYNPVFSIGPLARQCPEL